MSKIVAYVPIKHNSQRVPGKNYRLLGGHPLCVYIISTLASIEEIEKIYIDTDSATISAMFHDNPRIRIINRPDHLIGDQISVNKLLENFVTTQHIEPETVIVQTHVTNPFLSRETIQDCLHKFTQQNTHQNIQQNPQPDCLFTVDRLQKRLWNELVQPINHNPSQLIQTQDLAPIYVENSCLYVFTAQTILTYHHRLGEKQIIHQMPVSNEIVDIDTEDEFEQAEQMLRLGRSKQLNEKQPETPPKTEPQQIEQKPTEQKQQKPTENQNINEKLYQTIIEHTKEILANRNVRPNQTVMISAPYMIKDIDTFVKFYREIVGVDVIVAPVQERLEENQLLELAGKYQVALVGDDRYTQRAIDQSTNPTTDPITNKINNKPLRALCKWGTGIDSLNQEYCQTKGVQVLNTPNAFTIPVTESIIACILGYLRNTYQSQQVMHRTNQWVKIPSRTVQEVIIGIVGLGNIGSNLAKTLKTGFNANLIGYDIVDKSELQTEQHLLTIAPDLTTLLRKSDIICLCTTLSASSRHMINHETVKQIKQGAYLINMARGDLIDESSLISALESNHLSGCALDVFEVEPLPEQNKLRHLPNVLISAHNSNSSPKFWLKVHLNTIKNSLIALSD